MEIFVKSLKPTFVSHTYGVISYKIIDYLERRVLGRGSREATGRPLCKYTYMLHVDDDDD